MNNSVMQESTLLTPSQLGVATDKDRKSPRRWLTAGLSALCLGMFFAGAANVNAAGANLNVVNPGFEDPVLPAGGFLNTNPMPGWVKSGGGRIFHPTNQNNVAEGVNNYQVRATPGTLEQTLSDVLSVGTYNLSVAVGDQRGTAHVFADYRVQLGVMDPTAGFILLAQDDNTLNPDEAFATSVVSYTAVAADLNLGLPLVIRLEAFNTSSTAWVLFDDVKLSISPKGDYYLKAQPYDKLLPDSTGTAVPMWGFAVCSDASFATCTLDTNAAGPQINAMAGETLTLHLQNSLPVPVSVVIPGQFGGGDPTKVTDANGRPRMQSMTHETAPGATGTYQWTGVKSGTYLYHSGTHPSLQVPMGLYGAVVVVDSTDAITGKPFAYPGVGYDSDTVMLLSEVDPLQNARVSAAAAIGVATEACIKLADYLAGDNGYPCTIDYNPTYLLVNGAATQAAPPQITDGTAAQSVLVRFLNAGLRTHTPAFAGVPLSLVAEDGNKYPGTQRKQDSALLPAGKTMDALVDAPLANTIATGVTWAMYDHMSSFKNEAGVNGGAVASFNIGTGTPAPTASNIAANDDTYSVVEDTAIRFTGTDRVYVNDPGLNPSNSTIEAVTQPAHGKLGWITNAGVWSETGAIRPNGSFAYKPDPNFSGTDSFTYAATRTDTGITYAANVTLNVSFVNDIPVAMDDAYSSSSVGGEIAVDAAHGLLGNDSDVDGNKLTAVLTGAPIAGLALAADGSFTYRGPTTTFTYMADDGHGGQSTPATVSLTVTPAANVNLAVEEFGTGTLIDSYRWIVQEDNTYHLDPTTPQATAVLDQQSLNLHKSTMTVVAQGCMNCSKVDATGATVTYSDSFAALALDPTKYYYVSVLPNDAVSFATDAAGNPTRLAGHTIGGAQILPAALRTDAAGVVNNTVTVIVNKQEIPTAQIAVEVFQDTAPINGAIDGGEPGLGGFTITLEDGGGRYGISAGIMIQDTYGNPLVNAIPCFGPNSDQDYLTSIGGLGTPSTSSLIETCPNTPENVALARVGHALIKNLAPGKYGVIAVPPASEKTWVQTSTIEGTKIIDAWVKADEPPYFAEFGLTGPHAFIGFTRPEIACIGPARLRGPGGSDAWRNSTCQVPGPDLRNPTTPVPAYYTVSGKITALHDPKPPLPMLSVAADNADFFSATRFWVGLNSSAGNGPSIATLQANEDGTFTIPHVPNGNYQLVVWDVYLDALISYFAVDVNGADVNMITIDPNTGKELTQSVAAWFTRSEHNVFLDDACGAGINDPRYGNGVRDVCNDGSLEAGLQEQAVNIRWRDGTVNQSFPTDSTGFVPFDEAFPFFSWQLYEIDYLRYKPTGVTVTVDAGGTLQPGQFIAPQIQEPNLFTADNEACTPGTNALVPNLGTNGCTSRTETGAGVLLEAFQSLPGQTLLFDWGKVPYQPGENGGIAGIVFYSTTRAENDPRLTVGEPWEPGIANVKVRLYSVVQRQVIDPATGLPAVDPVTNLPVTEEALSLVKEIQTDSWDANPPTGCQGENDLTDPYVSQTLAGADGVLTDAERSRCLDGFRGWNQVRPGVFDGGYAFMTIPDPANPAGPEIPIPPGKYVVEVIPPNGYEQYKEEDVNVTMGDARTGDTTGVAPVSVTLPNGSLALILPDQAMIQASAQEPGLAQPPCVGQDHLVPAELSLFPGEPAPFAGATRKLCNRKLVVLSDQGQSAADFHLFTTTPVAAQYTGLITDDLSMETNPASVMMGEKFGPAYLPFTLRDYKGTAVYAGVADGFGRYNGLLPSTFSANIPMPSGYSPAMYQACLNESGATKNSRYIAECVTAQFMPGTNTYLDTPILPQSGFAGGFNPPDCEADNATPEVRRVNGSGFGPFVRPGGVLKIFSRGGQVAVPNPNYEGPLAPAPYNAPTVIRNYNFGAQGANSKVELIQANGSSLDLTPYVTFWGGGRIEVTLPADNTNPALPLIDNVSGELVVTRSNNLKKTTNTVTVTISSTETPIRVNNTGSIQAGIDAAAPGQLVLVQQGTYNERLFMWKPVRLQGSGSDTVIDARQAGAQDLANWDLKLAEILPSVDLLPGALTIDDKGAGITVVGKANGPTSFANNASRIDGFTITNAFAGGAVLVYSNATNLEIANNRITANSGQFGGGIRVGQPNLPAVEALPGQGIVHYNDNVNIHNNAVALNGGIHFESVGGGISMNYGSNGYTVANNFICGNYTNGEGAGIGHLGVSDGGKIMSNKILFNQAYNNSFTTSGGGIFIGGESLAGALGAGAGNVTIDSNYILGNHAASGHGGGIRLAYVNGSEGNGAAGGWWHIDITNNMIANNVAGWSGAGISLMDAVNTNIANNQVVSNDATATQGSLIVGNQVSDAKPSGIVSMPHSLVGAGVLPGTVSLPTLTGNTIWHNRTFHLNSNVANTAVVLIPELTQAAVGDCDATATYWDLGTLGTADTTLNGVAASTTAPAYAVKCNGSRQLSVPGPIQVFLGTGEGGNFADVRYGALYDLGTYPIP